MKYRIIAFLLIFVSLEGWSISKENNEQEKVLEVEINDGIYIRITGNDAMNIYKYLEENTDKERMFLVSEAGMSKVHISTPVIHCQKTDPGVYDPPLNHNDPSLYICDIRISHYGTIDIK